jgi:predicted GIY-YIG superfamily endonuclease
MFDKLDLICNLDLTKSYIYVLELEDERYYIGRTSNIIQRMEEHFNMRGSIYTKKYKPIKIKEIIEEKTHYDERNKTLEYMDLYNWEKVRGYAWCCEKLHKKPILKNKKIEIKKIVDYDNPDIRNMYLLENKDIIEIGNYLNKSPGSIAYSLERMGIVNRRQLSRGYFDYIFSDLYEKSKKGNEILRHKLKEKEFIKNDEDNINNNKLTKEDLNNLKKKIHDMLINKLIN